MPDSIKLLADIGGTNARFAIHSKGVTRDVRVLLCADYPDLVTAARTYMKSVDAHPRQVAMAIAAPLQGDAVRMTNHPWQFSVSAVRAELEVDRLIVLNDFTALALSIPHLPKHELYKVGGGDAVANAPIALIGPGTGLGVSGLLPTGEHWLPLQGEGGHATLAAANEREAAVLAVFRERIGHVSAERVISGAGLSFLHETLQTLSGHHEATLTAAQIVDRALANNDPICRETLDIFCAMLGTVAGNLALTLGAHGGVYIGGGIVPRFVEHFAQSPFRARFEDKGRYKSYLAPIPVHVIQSEMPAFVGLVRAFIDPAPAVVSR
ncbi:MAG TPA: glucokinase [Steroidobacteraceae bacterium]|nr:glucokinase [Steroidobacteraceae bacterium]